MAINAKWKWGCDGSVLGLQMCGFILICFATVEITAGSLCFKAQFEIRVKRSNKVA